MWFSGQSRYLFQKRGLYYDSWRAPKDVSGFFQRECVVFSLGANHEPAILQFTYQVSGLISLYLENTKSNAFTISGKSIIFGYNYRFAKT